MRTDLQKSPAELVTELESLRAQLRELRNWNGKHGQPHPDPNHTAFADHKERLQAALAASGTGTFRWDLRTDSLDWDENLDRLFGLTPASTARTLDQFIDLVHPDDRLRVITACRHCREEGTDFDEVFRVVHPDGSVHWLDDKGKTFFDREDRPAYMTGACVDVTARVIDEDRLSRLAKIAEQSPDFIGMADAEMRPIWVNPAGRHLVGLDSIDAVGRMRVIDYFAESEHARIEKDVIPLLLRDGHWDGEVLFRHFKTGETFPVFWNAFVVRNETTGQITNVCCISKDARERQRVEEQLRAAREEAERASRAKDDFLAALSHELRTPLAPVLLTASALERDPKLPPELLPSIQTIVRNVGLECRLIEDLLDITRIVSGKLHYSPQTIDLHALVENVLKICSHDIADKTITVSLRLAATPHHVVGDPARLQQILWNLIKNAAKFTPAAGSIAVSTRLVDPATIALDVADSGIGIDQDLLPRLFNAFEQDRATARQFGGLGLGLAISHRLAAMHGGTLTASSAGAGRGSTFTLAIPVHAPVDADVTPESPASISTPPRRPDQRLRVLLVEDHLDTLKVMHRLLSAFDCDVAAASSVQQAATVSSAATFDLLLSDLDLPDGTGLDVVSSLKQRQDLYAVALSGYGAEQDIRRSLDAGFDAHLAKPIDLHSLESLVSAVRSRVTKR